MSIILYKLALFSIYKITHLKTEVAAHAYAKSSLASYLVTLENHKLPSGSRVIRELLMLFIPPSVF
jgi:hypothetical protein